MNIQTAINLIKNAQSSSVVLAECDLLNIIVHHPEFETFYNSEIENAGFSGKNPVYALIGRFEKVSVINNRHVIAASESLEKLVTSLVNNEHPLDGVGMLGRKLNVYVVK